MEAIKAAQEQAAPNPAPAPQVEISRDEAVQTSRRIAIETETLSGSLNLTGARIDDLSLNNYMTEPQGMRQLNC